MEGIKSKTCIVTGANSGIGKAVALRLAKLGAEVVMVCRSRERGEAALKEIILKSGNAKVHLMIADLSSMKSIRAFADEFKRKFNTLHVLINNAGVSNSVMTKTFDGYEETFAVNHLGPFLLTNLLLDVLKKSAPSRIINVASIAHRGAVIDFDDLMREKVYSGRKAYSQSKLANIMFTYELAKRLKGTGVTVNAFCPGGVSTNIWRHVSFFKRALLQTILKPAEDAAELPVYLATAEEIEGVSGKYFEYYRHLRISKYIPFWRFDIKKAETKSSPQSYDEKAAKRLWEESERLVGKGLL
jgi:NAD(P)-dependent dehydrogenase (short-subunit alcohol dehydrogenase family)